MSATVTKSRAISVQHLFKTYSLKRGYNKDRTLAGSMMKNILGFFNNSNNKRPDAVEVLKDINFEVANGEVLGIIGPNGAGKSTLLKIISRITEPTKGKVQLYGRVASLLEVGTGFHYDMSGRENIFLNGAMLGMNKREIASKFDEIVDFSGVEEFIDVPLKRYSSGMQTRLGFAVAAYLDAEILLMDEVLSVGDAEFQKKCLNKISELSRGEGRTILFVSHNMGAVMNICKRVLFLKKGNIIQDGLPENVINQYLKENLTEGASIEAEKIAELVEYLWRTGEQRIQITRIAIVDNTNTLRNNFNSYEDVNIGISFRVINNVKDIRIAVSLVDAEGTYLLTSQTADSPDFIQNYPDLPPGNYTATCTIPQNSLGNKEYYINVDVNHPYHEHFVIRNALSLSITFEGYNNLQRAPFANVYFRPQLKWELERQK